MYEGQLWGCDRIDGQAAAAPSKEQPSFKDGWKPQGKTYLKVFMHLFPITWLQEVLLPTTSQATENNNSSPLGWGELLRFIGLWLLMSTCSGWTNNDFWNAAPYGPHESPCPYRFNGYMS